MSVINKENINMEYDINTYAVNKYPTRKNLRKIDKSTNKKTIFNKSLTIVKLCCNCGVVLSDFTRTTILNEYGGKSLW